MASISTSKDGKKVRTLHFEDAAACRRTLYLGSLADKAAQQIRQHVESILAAQMSQSSVPPETSRWLGNIGDKLHAKLVKFGLASPRQKDETPVLTVIDQIDAYLIRRVDVSEGTHQVYQQSRRSLADFFGDRPLDSVTPANAKDFKRHLVSQKYADATVAKRVKHAREFFEDAVDAGVLTSNPFRKVKAGSMANADKLHYITLDVFDRVLNVCPDQEWRVLFTLSRIGGLRMPSEPLALTWADVTWPAGDEPGRLSVADQKRKKTRIIPLFPRLATELQALFDAAEPGERHIITQHRMLTAFGTQARRIIRRAGVAPWARTFNNLRSSADIDIRRTHPGHVAEAWIGHGEDVARKHYLHVTDEDFRKATVIPTLSPSASTRQDNPTPEMAMQESVDWQGVASADVSGRIQRMTPTGFEPVSPP